MWHYCIWSRQSRIFEAAPFFDILMQKNWQQRAINHDKYFRQDRFYFFVPWGCKNINSQTVGGFSQESSNFHLQRSSVTF